jgi:lipoprotein NlpD
MNPNIAALSRSGLALTCAALLNACATTSLTEAPIIDKSVRPTAVTVPAGQPTVPSPPPSAPPVLSTATDARGDTYVVQRGDTLYSIALAFGQDYRDIARWNSLDDPTRIAVGQTLRVAPDATEGATAAVTVAPVAPAVAAQARPLEAPLPAPAGAAAPAATPPAAAPAAPPATSAAAATAAAGTAAGAPPAKVIEPAGSWIWPARGNVISAFDEARNKGIGIAGAEGDAVVAANDGQVVYVGNGLRGYGNLLIVKHSDDFISAYAHNRQVLVKQGQAVKRGQRVAEMGQSDADRPKLHFEIRRQGKPVDPLQYLPPR